MEPPNHKNPISRFARDLLAIRSCRYGVAMIRRLFNIIGLFQVCKRALQYSGAYSSWPPHIMIATMDHDLDSDDNCSPLVLWVKRGFVVFDRYASG